MGWLGSIEKVPEIIVVDRFGIAKISAIKNPKTKKNMMMVHGKKFSWGRRKTCLSTNFLFRVGTLILHAKKFSCLKKKRISYYLFRVQLASWCGAGGGGGCSWC